MSCFKPTLQHSQLRRPALRSATAPACWTRPGDSVDRHTPLPDLGLDSLMAVELRARVNVALDVEISALELSRSGGLASFALRLADQLAVPA